MSEKKKRHWILRGLFKGSRLFVAFVALPIVRNMIWSKATKKAEEKILDVEARVVGKNTSDEDKKL